jgi:penicillin-binding protein 1A
MNKILEAFELISESTKNFIKEIKKLVTFFKRKITLKRIEQLFIISLFIIFLGAGALAGFMVIQFKNMKNIRAIDDYSSYELPTEVYDRSGKKITEFFLYKRTIVPYNEIPKHLTQALISYEDQNFFKHSGIDFWGVVRAMLNNILAGRITQGGSTLTQQLAKRLFTSGERTFFRKFRELWYTIQIEKKFTKYEILEKYLNQIYFGHNTYGAEAACQYYFGKSVREITPAESAILVSLPSSPVYYSPIRYPVRARRKQRLVLDKMVKMGFISRHEAKESFEDFWVNFESRLVTNSFRSAWQDRLDLAPYWSEYVRQQLLKIFQGEELYTGGYKIYTTLDLKLQKLALDLVKKQTDTQNEIYYKNTRNVYKILKDTQTEVLDFLGVSFGVPGFNFKNTIKQQEFLKKIRTAVLDTLDMTSYLNGTDRLNTLLERFRKSQSEQEPALRTQGALVSMDVNNGHILAMVGGTGFTQDNQLNRAYQARRQPGSAFKPYVYLTALLTEKFSAASTVKDEPIVFSDSTGRVWVPENAGGSYLGKIRLRDALRMSVNIVSVKLVEALTPETIMKMATLIMGIENPEQRFRYDLSIGLGTNEISPYEMMVGYSTFATLGKRVEPIAILRITDRNGKVIRNFEADRARDIQEGKICKQVIPKQHTFILVDMMKDVVKAGTATGAANKHNWTRISAGKTGTTQHCKDAWFVGFTKDVVTAVWVGFDKSGMSLGPDQYGGEVAAPIWMEYMKVATEGYPNSDWTNPGGLVKATVTRRSGLLVHKNSTDETFTEYFIPSTVPKKYDMEWKNEIVQQRQIERIDPFRDDRRRALNGGNAPDMNMPSSSGTRSLLNPGDE